MRNVYKGVLVLILLFVSISNHLFAVKYYVSKSGNNTNGSSWVNAYTDLQAALGVASDGDTIVVAKGVYTPSATVKTVAFSMVAGVRVFGGFVGDEIVNQSAIDGRDFETNETVLSGDLLDNDGGGYFADNSYTVVVFDAWNAAMSNTTILDGFTISGGYSAGSSLESANGGGIYMQMGAYKDCNPLLRNLVVKENKARSGGGMYLDGLIDSYAQISPTLENIVFDGNEAYHSTGSGGGIYMAAGPNASINPVLKGVAFVNNIANASGGGIFFLGGYLGSPGNVSATISNATFYNNSCGSGNGNAVFIHGVDGIANPVFNNAIFYGNPASQIFKAVNAGTANPSFNHCLIAGSPSTAWDSNLGVDLGNNIDGDPLFADPENGNLGVLIGSPVLGAGDNAIGMNIGYYQGSGITVPVITAMGSLNDFGTVDLGSISAEQTFTVSGSDLLNSITVEAPTGFEVSLSSGAGFFSQIYLHPFSGSVETTTVYVRFKPGASGGYSGNVEVRTPGATSELIAVAGYAGSSPEISVIDNRSVCENVASEVSFTVTDDELSTLQFDVSVTSESVLPVGNASITGSNGSYVLTVNPISAGVVDVTITVTDADNNISTQPFQLTVMEGVALEVAFSPRVCNGDPAEINISSTGGTGIVTYKLNDGPFSFETNYNYLGDGEYVVVALDEFGCTDTSAVYIVVNPEYITGTADLTKGITCRDDNDAEITVSPAGGWGGFEYSLDGVDYQQSNMFVNLGPGDYNVYVRDQGGCSQLLFSTNVMNPELLAIDYVTVSDIEQSQNKELNIVAYGGWMPYSYSIDGTQYQEESFFKGVTAGSYTAYVKDKEGCIATKAVEVNLTSIFTLDALGISIYPNPTSDYVFFENIDSEIERVELFSISGQNVFTIRSASIQNHSISLKSIGKGVYLMRVHLRDGRMGHAKVIVL